MDFKPLKDIDDVLNFIEDNIEEFPSDRVSSIIDTIKEKKLEIFLQTKISKEKFDFSETKNYPLDAHTIVEIVNNNTKKKVSPFEIAEFFDIKVNKILESSNQHEIAYLDYDHKSDKVEIFYRDYSDQGYENVNEFLVSHELGHLFNHFLLGTFFSEQSYTLNKHDFSIENLREAVSKENIANNDTYKANEMLSKKRSLNNSRAAFSTNNQFDNSFEIEADMFAFNLLFYPKKVTLTEVMFFRLAVADICKKPL